MAEFSLYGCFAPRKVFNKYLGREIVANCGKCAYCRSLRSFDLTSRVQREFVNQGANTALFITLTYDNDHLPVYQYNGRSRRWHSNCGYPDFGDIPEQYVSDYPAPVGYDIDAKMPLLALGTRSASRFKKRPAFAHLCYPDVQKYLNLVRAKFYAICARYDNSTLHIAYSDPDLTYETFAFRYAVCGEYGPSSLRPHYHCIIWLNHQATDKQLSALSQIFSESWSFGNIDVQTVTSDGVSGYLADYVTGVNGIPSILQGKRLRPLFHFSQAPTIGMLRLGEDEVQKMLFTGDAIRRRYDDRRQSVIVEELPLATLSKYFPKCKGYSTDDFARLRYVYGYTYRYFQERGITHLPDEVDALRMVDIPFPVRLMSADASRYYRVVPRLLGSAFNFPDNVRAGLWTWCRADRYASLQCYRMCVKYGITPDTYIYQLRSIYSRIHSRKLGRFYEWCNDHPDNLTQAINVDPFALADVHLGVLCSSALSSYFGYALDECPDTDDLRRRSLDDNGYLTHIGRYTKLSDDRVKRKKLNDYRKGLNVMKTFVSPHNNN